MDILGWLTTQYTSWDDEKRILFQSEVADEVPDIEVGRFLAALSMGDTVCSLTEKVFWYL